jgi:hypothetical protein
MLSELKKIGSVYYLHLSGMKLQEDENILLVLYYYGYKLDENKVGGTCSPYGVIKKLIQGRVVKPVVNLKIDGWYWTLSKI